MSRSPGSTRSARLLCVADLHLGQGVERYGPDRLRDQELVWDEVAHIAYREACDAVLFAGDAFDRRRFPSQAELCVFGDGLEKLHAYGIPVVGISGNHDVLAPDEPTSLRMFRHRMTLAETPRVVEVAGVHVACLPWTTIAHLVARRNGGDRDALYQEAAALLHSTLRGLRAEIPMGEPAVLLAHWSASGAVTPTGREVGLDFGVVLDTAEVEAMGWDAVVLGHIHKAQNLNTTHDDFRASGPIFYAGSPLPLNHGEADVEHGVWILETEGGAYDIAARFIPIESRPFFTIDAEAEAVADLPRFEWPEVASAIVRVRYTATEEQARRIDQTAIKPGLLDAGAFHVTVKAEILREDRARVHIDTDALDELGALQMYLDANGVNGTRGAAMIERTSKYLQETL